MLAVLAAAFCIGSVRLFFWKLFGESRYGGIAYLLYGSLVPRCVEYYFYSNPSLFDLTRCGESGLSSYEQGVMSVSAGYFLQTTFFGCFLREEWYLLLHHGISFAVVSTPLYMDCCAFEILLCLWVGEYTTPCAFWIFFYKKDKVMYNCWPMVLNKSIYFLFFLVLRFGVGSYLFWVWLNCDTLLVIKAGCVFMIVFNLYVVWLALVQIKDFLATTSAYKLKKHTSKQL